MDVFNGLEKLYGSHKGEKGILGVSYANYPIYYFKIGRGKPVIISQYAIHAREYSTAFLAFRHIQRGLNFGSAYIVPLVNPDGARLCLYGAGGFNARLAAELKSINGGDDFSLWKANARGVDLNVNFDAQWGKGAANVFYASPSDYVGNSPFSERETRSLARFTLNVKPSFTVSWHTKGEVIYYGYSANEYYDSRVEAFSSQAAVALGKYNGYLLEKSYNSGGGYKDWCMRLKIPSLTVEAGEDDLAHPINESLAQGFINKNEDALNVIARQISVNNEI